MPTFDIEDQTLETLLVFHGLTHWLPLLQEWCSRFEGWYTAADLQEEPTVDFVPVSQVMLALSQQSLSLGGSNSNFATLLSGLDFAYCYATLDDTAERWNPIAEPFRVFAARGEVRLLQDDRPFMPFIDIQNWLLARLE